MSEISGGKKFVRRRNGRMAGICAGMADYLEMDVNLVRALTVGITIVTFGAGLLAYLLVWLFVPEEGKRASIADDLLGKNRRGRGGEG